MAWNGTQDPAKAHECGNNLRPVKDVFTEFAALEGELGDEQAKATLAEFLYHNPAFLFDILGGIKLFPLQEIILKGWARNDYNLAVYGRGLSKSWSAALFALYWAMFNPGVRIVIISFAFRASRRILEQCEKFINDKDASLLRTTFPEKVQHKTDEWLLKVPNGATLQCLPLGDGTKIRGVRADVLIVDEFAFLPETIIGEILRPFLAAKNKIKEQRSITEREDELIAAGLLTEKDRTVLEDRKKVIFLSSACYAFEHMAKRYRDWIALLSLDPKAQKTQYDEFKESERGYFISRLAWDAAPAGLLDLKEIDQARRESSESMFNREYGAQFTEDSGGYFKASKMAACSVTDGETPCLELVGDKTAEYVVAIDTASSGAEDADHFAVCVLKLTLRESDGVRVPMVVHSYAVAGGNLKDHTLYFYYILKHFNVVYIATDASQGDNVEFLNSSIQSKLFKDAKIELCDIEADFKGHEFKELPAQIKRSYNRTMGRIIQKQPFSPVWQRQANEWLQASIDHKRVRFAGKIAANSGAAGAAMNTDISMLLQHEDFKDMTPSQFIDLQDTLIDMTRKECAMIVVSTTDTGLQQFRLPQNVRRSGGPGRMRKDSYSALLLGVWASKMYIESQGVQVVTGPVDFNYAMVGGAAA